MEQSQPILNALFCLFVYLFVYGHLSIFFSYPAAVTITGDGAANLDLCLALMAFSNEGSFSCHTYCDTGPRFIWSHTKDRHPRPTVGFETGTQISFISKRRIISLMHSSILRQIWLNFMAQYLVFRLLSSF
jgi:hypothetical protein